MHCIAASPDFGSAYLSRKMRISCLIVSFISAGCAKERIVEVPVPVEVVKIQRVQVPDDFLTQHNPVSIPEKVTYGRVLELWAVDRSIIETQNGQLRAIGALNEQEGE